VTLAGLRGALPQRVDGQCSQTVPEGEGLLAGVVDIWTLW